MRKIFVVLIVCVSLFIATCGGSDTGNTGDTGDTGNTGDTGDTGNTGNTGDTGNTGNSGDTGNTGDTVPDDDSECVEGDRRCTNIEVEDDDDSFYNYSGEAVELCLNGSWTIIQECYDYEVCEEGYCDGPDYDAKPNIYLYPVVETQVQVSINFPKGGHVTVSDPEYKTGWDVTVTPDGIIDDSHTFLFYEAVQPDLWQKDIGWVIAKEDLEEFFFITLESYGFVGDEVADFIEWWVPRLTDFSFYIIRPQLQKDIEIINKLKINPKPDSLLRFRFHITGTDNPLLNLTRPELPQKFERKDFTVTEWGVILGKPVY